MEDLKEITLSEDKFLAVSVLREVLSLFNTEQYSCWGSLLSNIHFKNTFSGSFEILVRDESEAVEILDKHFKVDLLHGVVETNTPLKIKLVDSTAKNEMMRQFLIDHSETRTVVMTSKSGELEKVDIEVPRRGPTIIALALEVGEQPANIASFVGKVIWSLENVGVGPILREVRYAPKESINKAADIIEELFVAKANKTVSMIQTHLGSSVSITAAELKRLGRPYAALLRA